MAYCNASAEPGDIHENRRLQLQKGSTGVPVVVLGHNVGTMGP